MEVQFRVTEYNDSHHMNLEDKPYFKLVFRIITTGSQLTFGTTDCIRLNENGQLPEESRDEWGKNFVMLFRESPLLIFVYVCTFDSLEEGKQVNINKMDEVDSFAVVLGSTSPPTPDNILLDNQTLEGREKRGILSVSISISCLGSSLLDGSFCDLNCKRSTINETVTECKSYTTNSVYVCKYVDHETVDRCVKCPYGVKDDTYCDEWSWRKIDWKQIIKRISDDSAVILPVELCMLSYYVVLFLWTIKKRTRKNTKQITV